MKKNITNRVSLWQFKSLAAAVLAGLAGSVTHASLENHGDLEIYKGPQEALPVITLMLDVSGSMDSIDAPSGCQYRYYRGNYYYYTEDDYGYTTYYCKLGDNKYYRRIDNLKMGVSDLVKDPDLKDIVKLGIGTYPRSGSGDKNNGHIDIPAKKLNAAHKADIDTFIATLSANGITPAAQAYAEAGAYMMGTTTNSIVDTPFSLYKDTFKNYRNTGFDNTSDGDQKCTAWESIDKSSLSPDNNFIKCTNWQNVSKLNTNTLDRDGHEVYATQRDIEGWGRRAYYVYTDFYRQIIAANDPLITSNNIVPYPLIDTTVTNYAYSGFPYSADNTKTDNKRYYEKPLPESDATCAGNGIYFLTDGKPNASSSTIAKTVMNNALKPVGSSTGALSVTCNSGGSSGWDCMADFSEKLLNTANPSGIAIKTATVGFGSVYSGIQNATTNVDCNASNDANARNLCNLGINGQGGFYYAESAEDIVNSVKSLTGKLTTEIPPISTGSMAVPLDDLNVSTSRKFAYLPILDPDPLSPNKLWRGNLKKYNVKNGTLVDKSNKPIFTGKDGEFALNTSDLYNTIIDTSRPDTRRPDLAKPQVGGTYQHIFENNNSRKLFVNQGGTLKNIRTDATNAAAKPVGFDALDSSIYTNTQKQQLLNFLGFPVANSLTINDNTAIGVPFDRNKKQLGGVLHSLPQLISKKAALKADGSIDNTKREDYVLYGSLDGALHVVRDTSSGSDKAGEEVFTFIPKHVLEQQGASFVDLDTVAQNPIFGVDGPWSVFNNYKYSDTKVTALQTLAFGGLRMGGSMYYGLNLSDLSDPELIYSVGSTYAMDGSANAKGIKNDAVANATTNTSQQKAYARMGLSFAQPSVGYVMRDGKRVMVNFLAGGYDRCYEDPKFQLGSNITTNTVAGCNGKTAAQGNGIYMVQVGEEKVDSTSETNPDASNESSFDTTSGNGDLLWWTSSSNNGAGNANFTKVTDMNHSVVTEIRVLDRNYDGLTDQLVFADLGGRVWRVDINSAEDADDFVVERVTKLLDLSASGSNAASSGTDALPRIYEKPLVTFTRLGEGTDIVGLVTVGTGDRSSPVRAQRNVADRIYTFVDRDIARPDLFCYDVQDTPNDECDEVTTTLAQPSAITPADLVPLTSNNSGEFTNTQTIKTQMDSYTKLGWYLPLTMWSEKTTSGTQAVTTDNRGLKMFNQPDAIAGLLFTTVYNPNVGDTSGVCSAGVTGRTQREQLCLPYGVCLSKDVDSDGALTGDWVVRKTRYVSNAGIGIVDNIIADGNFDGDTQNSVVVLENYCEGGDCSDGKVNLEVNPLTEGLNCQGTSCQVVTDSRIDPMQWKER